MWQADTIVQPNTSMGRGLSVKKMAKRQLTPAKVLEQLPADATPSQQDSAIQANFKPGPIRWSQQPDTLHLPGYPIGKSYRDVSLPQYYKESFFSNDSLYHPEISGGRIGVAGDPMPYNIASDNILSVLLLGFFMIALMAFPKTKRFVVSQVKHFFYVRRSNTTFLHETASELRFKLFFVLQTCFLFSLVGLCYTRTIITETFIFEPYEMIAIYMAVLLVYFLLTSAVYGLVNWTFFDGNKNEQWMESRLFLIAVEGIALYPIVMMLSYDDVSINSVLIYVCVVIILIKLLALSKQYVIFFGKTGDILQFILYFCSLELIPLCLLWGVFNLANSYLKVIF